MPAQDVQMQRQPPPSAIIPMETKMDRGGTETDRGGPLLLSAYLVSCPRQNFQPLATERLSGTCLTPPPTTPGKLSLLLSLQRDKMVTCAQHSGLFSSLASGTNDPKSDVSSRTQSKVLKPLEMGVSEAGLGPQYGLADTGIGCRA